MHLFLLVFVRCVHYVCGSQNLNLDDNAQLTATLNTFLANTVVINNVLFFLGPTDISFIDPVVIGRNVFSVINDFVSGITGYIQDMLCSILDVTLDILKGSSTFFFFTFI